MGLIKKLKKKAKALSATITFFLPGKSPMECLLLLTLKDEENSSNFALDIKINKC